MLSVDRRSRRCAVRNLEDSHVSNVFDIPADSLGEGVKVSEHSLGEGVKVAERVDQSLLVSCSLFAFAGCVWVAPTAMAAACVVTGVVSLCVMVYKFLTAAAARDNLETERANEAARSVGASVDPLTFEVFARRVLAQRKLVWAAAFLVAVFGLVWLVSFGQGSGSDSELAPAAVKSEI